MKPLLLLIPAAALAGEPSSVVVHFGDLNLGSQQARHELHVRITHAADHVCHYYGDQREPLEMEVADRACVVDAVRRAEGEVVLLITKSTHPDIVRVASR